MDRISVDLFTRTIAAEINTNKETNLEQTKYHQFFKFVEKGRKIVSGHGIG